MKIDIACLVRYPELHERMAASAKKTASVASLGFITQADDGLPHLAAAYNRMAAQSDAEIVLFVHDDVHFMEPGWDGKLIEALLSGFDVAGVVGSREYSGGRIFDSGNRHGAGKFVCQEDGIQHVKLLGPCKSVEPVAVIDGMFMAVKKSHWQVCRFDEQFDELFFYDLDYCLRSRCCVVDTLIAHEKPKEHFGKYPEHMKPIEHYWAAFHDKHSLSHSAPIENQVCHKMTLPDFLRTGQQRAYADLQAVGK